MEDLVFTHNWFLKNPKAVENIKRDWSISVEQCLDEISDGLTRPEFKDIEHIILNLLDLVPLVLDGTPEKRLFNAFPFELLFFGSVGDQCLHEVAFPYSGSSGLWRQKPLEPFKPVARGRILEDQIILKFYCKNSALEQAHDTLCAIVEQMRQVLPSHQPMIDDHNVALRTFLPAYLRQHEPRIRNRLESPSLDFTTSLDFATFGFGRRFEF